MTYPIPRGALMRVKGLEGKVAGEKNKEALYTVSQKNVSTLKWYSSKL